ncbi:MAG: hypothetical protein VW378_03785 [bacterium]
MLSLFRNCFFFLVFFFSGFQLFAEDIWQFSVSSNYISIDSQMGVVHIRDKALLSFESNGVPFDVSSEAISCDLKARQVDFLEYLSYTTKNVSLYFKRFSYNAFRNEARGDALVVRSDRLHLLGKKVFVDSKSLTMFDGRFSSCSRYEHYWVSSKRIYIYPRFNIGVALGNSVHFSFLPFPLPFPVFFSALTQSLGHRSLFPVVGRSVQEGGYVRQEVPYFLNKQNSGFMSLGYTNRLGFLFGFDHRVVLSQRQSFNLVSQFYHKHRSGYGIEHVYNLKPLRVLNPLHVLSLTLQGVAVSTQTLSSMYKERILLHDSWVSYQPFFKVKNQFKHFLYSQISLESIVSYGSILESREEGDLSLDTFRLRHYVSRKFQRGGVFYTPFLKHDYYHYSDKAPWERVRGGVSIKLDSFVMSPVFRFSYMLLNRGQSAFQFEDVYAVTEHEAGMSLETVLKRYIVSFDVDYQLESETLRRLEIAVLRVFHCVKLGIIWDDIRRNISFTVKSF